MTLEDLCFVNLRVTVSNLSFNTPHSSWSFSATSPANIISKYTISINKSSCTLLLPRFPLLGPTKCGRSSVAPPPLDQHHRYLIAHWCHLFNYCSLSLGTLSLAVHLAGLCLACSVCLVGLESFICGHFQGKHGCCYFVKFHGTS